MKNFSLFFLLSFFIEGVFAESVSLTDGDSLTLHTKLTEIKGDDVLEWRFGAGRDRLARVRKDSKPTIYDDVLNGRFRGRLKPDGLIGDLTITNISTEHTGLYEISINTITIITFNVIVVPADPVKTVSVMEGDSVTLTGVTEILKYDEIWWTFGPQNSPIAEINRKASNISTSDVPDGRFRDRLKLDYLTGSLTIMNIGTKHSGLYEVDISSSKHTIHKSFSVTVSGEMKSERSVMEGYSVTLLSGLAEIQREDSIHWMFGDTRIAELYKADNRVLFNDGRFRGRLDLDHQTGSLTITDIRFKDSGHYDLKIISRRRTVHKRFTVTVTGSGSGSGSGSGLSAGTVAGICVVGAVLLVLGAGAVVAAVIYRRRWISELKSRKFEMLWATEGESVTLKAEIRKADGVQVKFRDALIAERKTANGEFTVHDGIFKDRLQLEKGSGYLIITNTSSDMFGDYELRILRRGQEILKTFIVTVLAKSDLTEMKIVMEGESFTLPSYVTGTQRDDQLEWKFKHEDSPIAQIKGGIPKCFPSAAGGRFGDRLMLDKNGSLTITNTKTTDAGVYGLYNTESGHKLITSFNVVVLYPKYFKNNPEEVPLTGVGVSDSCL